MFVTAEDMARAAKLSPKRFRAALRRADFGWHAHYARWTAEYGSPEHADMLKVLKLMLR